MRVASVKGKAAAPRVRRVGNEIPAAVARVEQAIAAGCGVDQACRLSGVSVPSYYRWRAKQKGGAQPDDTREQILRAAKTFFLREGYETDLASVAAAAGVSRQTVYNQFGSKEALFSEVVQAVHLAVVTPILVLDPGADFLATLQSYGRQFMKMSLDPEKVALFKVALSEYRNRPELAQLTYALRSSDVVPVLMNHIGDYLRKQMELGVIERSDPVLAAEAFCGALTSCTRHRVLIGLPNDPAERLEAMLELCTNVFARGLGYLPRRLPEEVQSPRNRQGGLKVRER